MTPFGLPSDLISGYTAPRASEIYIANPPARTGQPFRLGAIGPLLVPSCDKACTRSRFVAIKSV